MKQKSMIFVLIIGLIFSSLLLSSNEVIVNGEEDEVTPLNIEFSTLLGGNDADGQGRVAIDSQGNIILASESPSTDFPIVNAYQPEKNGSDDGVIIKLSPDGQEMLFSTFFGGNADEYIFSVAVDNNDDIIIAGTTGSTDLPLKNAIKTNRSTSAREVFLAKFSSDGQELYFSTYICGTDKWVVDLGIDPADNIVLVGSTDVEELLHTSGSYQPNKNDQLDAFATKISPDGQTVLFSTFLGGNKSENIRSMTLDSEGNIILSGYTNSDDFPQVNNLCNRSISTYDNYISKLSANGQELLFSSYYGGDREWGLTELTVDHNDNIIFVGETNSISFPLVNANQSSYAGGETDGFIAKIDGSDYSISFSTFFGGSNYDGVHGVIVDNNGAIVVCGSTKSSNLPELNPYHEYNGDYEAYICKLTENGHVDQLMTYFGGAGSDYSFGLGLDTKTNSIIMFGHTNSVVDFPLVRPIQNSYKGGYWDMFFCKFSIATTTTSTETNYTIIIVVSIVLIAAVAIVIIGRHRSS